MPIPRETPLTELLNASQAGDAAALEAVANLVYRELRDLASAYLRREGTGEYTLQPTALVSEAYLRLLGQDTAWQNRGHFFGIAAQAMRRILVDRARHRSAQRRDHALVVTLDDQSPIESDGIADVLGVHDALDKLATLDARQVRIVELKFFVGLTLEEIADVLAVSTATVSREWGDGASLAGTGAGVDMREGDEGVRRPPARVPVMHTRQHEVGPDERHA